jgi:hypothetical protein
MQSDKDRIANIEKLIFFGFMIFASLTSLEKTMNAISNIPYISEEVKVALTSLSLITTLFIFMFSFPLFMIYLLKIIMNVIELIGLTINWYSIVLFGHCITLFKKITPPLKKYEWDIFLTIALIISKYLLDVSWYKALGMFIFTMAIRIYFEKKLKKII